MKLFRLTPGGTHTADRIELGHDVPPSRLVDALLDAGAIHPHPRRRTPHAFGTADVTLVVPTLGDPAHVVPGSVVVDDGSQSPVVGATIRLARNRGPAAARNAGLLAVTTALVAFVDADVVVPDGWLDALLPHFDDERVALVAPRVIARGGGAIGRYERSHSPLDMGPDPARVRAGTKVGYVPAAALVCRVDEIRRIGGFDEGLRFGEDVDLVWRLDRSGRWCRYEPASTVQHDTRRSWRTWLAQRVDYGSSAGPLARRHPGDLAPLRMSGWSLAAWMLVVLGRPVVGVAVGAGSAVALVRKLPDVPASVSLRLAGTGNLRAGLQIADAVRRSWWPLVALTAVRSRTARRVLLAATVTSPHPMRMLDDVAYSVGVWRGMLAARTLAPVVPRLNSWPGRSATVRPAAER